MDLNNNANVVRWCSTFCYGNEVAHEVYAVYDFGDGPEQVSVGLCEECYQKLMSSEEEYSLGD